MIDWLPDFLDGLFNMLSDGNREIRQAADSALSEFLREIKSSEVVEVRRGGKRAGRANPETDHLSASFAIK